MAGQYVILCWSAGWDGGCVCEVDTHLHAHMGLAVLADENLAASEVNLRTTTTDTCISTIFNSLSLIVGRASRLCASSTLLAEDSVLPLCVEQNVVE